MSPKAYIILRETHVKILWLFDEILQSPKGKELQGTKKNLTFLKIHSIIVILKQGGTNSYDKK